MKKKVVLAGGTGFIGQFLEKQFIESGYEVVHISRRPEHISWTDQKRIMEALDGAEMLINLAGKTVNCRYNDKNKKEIMQSRTETTEILGQTIANCDNPPPLWINSSTATIYRHAEDRPMTEADGEIGSGFSVEVAKAWEASLFEFDLPKTRQVALRIAIVLGKDGGVMEPYVNLVRFGLGGVQGPGNQMFSWIHIEDLYRIVLFIKENEQLEGVFNCAAPTPITNRELMAQFRKRMNRKFGLSSPKWMLEMGAVFIGTETELILKSRWVVPERLKNEGFHFKFETIEKALQQILK
ncbi:TIGR01777 family oxidoreductase [Sporosarcina thermotolerans]|uniref:TIGR01777 family oxidoreductase n=1 Tax=Sporosarcina thermotolerans TaxID=633404 RepID=A0AAW9AA11_9BACL|nr:TIGR01777 family oxidoreductase [Sporosarcina thermotolerans]MDW0116518.1 TIGR01777 family oxidoreductase [Sporosarcina thermotolerans]